MNHHALCEPWDRCCACIGAAVSVALFFQWILAESDRDFMLGMVDEIAKAQWKAGYKIGYRNGRALRATKE